ncbi:MAG TPA: GTPase HflX [Deltaproteobacteria bacterium]|nr:GTPase HflX [Deltaproteobacteria bacterium]
MEIGFRKEGFSLDSSKLSAERAVLVGIRHPGQSSLEARESLFELERLVHTAGARVVAATHQEIKKIEPSTYIGKGKLHEIGELVVRHQADTVVFDEDLTPGQNRNLEKALRRKVVDRTGLILDIFAQHAKSKEGKLQVELAQSLYLLPRLVGQWEHFGRLGGGIGTRGPGETQLEVDRRRVRERLFRIRRQLQRVEQSRHLHRRKREGVPLPTVAMVGYTNAGKSTLMNRLTGAGVLVEDKLFATLDPTVRRLSLPLGREVLLSDTVGFIRKLPHALVEAFKATFEEVRAADLLLHVIDASYPTWQEQKQVVESVLKELRLLEKPRIEVYNKIDLLGASAANGQGARISARSGFGIQDLMNRIEEHLNEGFKTFQLKIPYARGDRLEWLYRVGEVQARQDEEDGVMMQVSLAPDDAGRLRKDRQIRMRTIRDPARLQKLQDLLQKRMQQKNLSSDIETIFQLIEDKYNQ